MRMLSTQNQAQIAANNNADLCAAIMAANGLRTERNENAYICIDDPLPYYPKMITLNPIATDELNERAKGLSGVKDSFSCLDVDLVGMQVAFDATWIWSETKQQTMPAKWRRIENAHDLAKWHKAWGGDGSQTDTEIFTPECLKDPNLAFFARLSGMTMEAGCIANLSEAVVGMSNVFSAISNDQSLFGDALSAVSTVGIGRPVVGYERGADLEAATSVGFQPIGSLRLLIR
ncbi:MAG: hypothetical protein ABJL99_02345 [Aliishimia sp.]